MAKKQSEKPQGILHHSEVRESDVDLSEFQKKWREGIEEASKKNPPSGGVRLGFKHRERRPIKSV